MDSLTTVEPIPRPDWLDDILGSYDYPLTPADLDALANATMTRQIDLEDRQYGLDSRALDLASRDQDLKAMDQHLAILQNDYLTKQLGLQGDQLARAQKEFEFQSGPWWDWYVNEKFPGDMEIARNQVQMSKLNLKNAQNQQNLAALQQLAASGWSPYGQGGPRMSGY